MSELVRPRYDGESIVNLANTLLRHFGLPTRRSCLRKEISGQISSERIMLIVIDGVNVDTLRRAIEDVDELTKLRENVYEITTTFPSTTSTALVSLSTGLEPGHHGVLGTTMYFREIGSLVNTLSLSIIFSREGRDQIPRAGFDVFELIGVRSTVFKEISEAGVRVRAYVPRGLTDGISRILYYGCEIVEFSSAIDAIVNSSTFLNDVDRGLSYVYIPYPDQVSHRHGTSSAEYIYTVCELLRMTFKICSKLIRRSTTVIVTSDHGVIDVDEKYEVNMRAQLPELCNRLLVPPYGDSRASNLVLIDRDVDNALKCDEVACLREHFDVLRRDELIGSGILGEVRDDVRARVGDIVILSRSRKYLRYDYVPTEREGATVRAHHGSILRDEMLVPLMVLNL